MQLYAFRGTRYSPANGDPGSLAAPPFDQIDEDLAARLRARPHHFAHLTRPDPALRDSHAEAAQIQARWLDEGVLIEDDVPALYLYQTRLATGGSRLGLCGLLGLSGGKVRPHERTVPKTVHERLDLMRKIRTDLEPIFLLCNDGGKLETELQSDLEGARWLASCRDEFGHTHSIAAIQDDVRIEHYQGLLGDQSGFIADGHHCYQVSRLYAKEAAAKPHTAPACKLVVLVGLGSLHTTIDPIHRGVSEPVDLERFRSYLRQTVPWRGQTGSGLALAVAMARQPAIGIWEANENPLICTMDADRTLAHSPRAVPELSVTMLHSLFDELGWDEDAAADGTVVYRSDPDKLFHDMTAGRFTASFWLPPMSAEDFSEALAICDLLPPKSTRFLPKLASGLVWARHDAPLR